MTVLEPSPRPIPTSELPPTSDLLVVGAGAMGSWTAFWAQTGGRQVTLLDAWGAGNSRSTSGDESRIIRSAHGADRLYTRWSRRSRDHWLRFQAEWGLELLVPTGALWFAHRDGAFEDATIETLRAEGIPHERLDPADLSRRWPHIRADDLRFALFEPEGGALMARRACQAVTRAFQGAGGSYGMTGVTPGRGQGGRLLEVVDAAGGTWSAGSFVFACGPWLPRLFPEVLGSMIRVTKQDVLFIGPAPGDRRFHGPGMPAWVDYDASFYGLPALDDRGFKLAPDHYGPLFDPSRGDRLIDPETIRLTRGYLRARFPDLAERPVVETRVCQYETTADAHFVLARHPAYENVWLAGGGSGHGFKHGPRIGEYLVARLDGAAEGNQDGPDEARFGLHDRRSCRRAPDRWRRHRVQLGAVLTEPTGPQLPTGASAPVLQRAAGQRGGRLRALAVVALAVGIVGAGAWSRLASEPSRPERPQVAVVADSVIPPREPGAECDVGSFAVAGGAQGRRGPDTRSRQDPAAEHTRLAGAGRPSRAGADAADRRRRAHRRGRRRSHQWRVR